MIVFNLKCEEGHSFEGWFASSSEFDDKAANHDLTCPECGGTHITKGLSAPRVNGGVHPEPSVGPCGMPCGSSGGMCGMMPD